MSSTHRTEGVSGNDPAGNRSPECHRRDIDVLSRTTELALESAKAILDHYDDVVSKAHRETAVLLWRGISEAQVVRDVLLAAQPTKRFVEVGEIAALCTFLASPQAASVTGTILPIDGGWTAH